MEWWKELPCHLSPVWDLQGTRELDLRKLKRQIDDDLRIAPYFMKAESLLYKAFLEVPPKSFLNRGPKNHQKALKILEEAEKHVETAFGDDRDAKNGYGIVIYAFRMWIYSEPSQPSKMREVEITLEQLKSSQTPKSQAFVNVTLAASLSRLGLQRYEEAAELFSKALEQYPGNTHWMFGRALMLGRIARSAFSHVSNKDKVPDYITKQFRKERKLLEDIRTADPSFAWPIAYLGLCLFNLKMKDDGVACLEEAIRMDKQNTDIALLSARVYKWMGQHSKSREILVNLPEESKTPEVLFQLGLGCYKRALKLSSKFDVTGDKKDKKEQLLKEALEYMELAVEGDNCHFPALVHCAEISARLGENEEANEKYLNLFQRTDILPVTELHIRRSANFWRDVLAPADVLDNLFRMLNLFVSNFTTFDDNGVRRFEASVEEDAGKFLRVLDAKSKDTNYESKSLATMYLAKIQRRMGKYHEAKQLIVSLIDSDQDVLKEAELRWILGKCHLDLGELDDAECQARVLERLPFQQTFPADELYADVYLSRAKGKLSDWSSTPEDVKHYVIKNLEEAIRKGSIEACYLYLTKVDGLQERLCSLEENIPQTLAEINKCMKGSITYHKDFPVLCSTSTPSDPVDLIEERIQSVLLHPKDRIEEDGQEASKKRFAFLSETRRHLLDFERRYLEDCNDGKSWSPNCQKEAEKVLSNAKNLLDHVICDYQIRVLKVKPKDNKFPVHFDWKEAKEDRDAVWTKFNGYLKHKFPGYKMPEKMIKFFVELQPMYSKDNLWLPALCSYTGDLKHTGTHDNSDTYEIVITEADPILCSKVDLVRRSCFEVEKIAEFIITFLKKQPT